MHKDKTAIKNPVLPRKAKTHAKDRNKTAGEVRIIGGQFKRRKVTFIDADGLRPTPDRLRETLFNWLLSDIHDARVLDSCAGSGVLGFEALSRGAAHCTFIETHPAQSKMLEQSAQQFKLASNSYEIICGAAEQLLNQPLSSIFSSTQPFDIVFIDPPYADDLWQPILTALISNELITTDTLIYLEADKELGDQLEELTAFFNATSTMSNLNGFECLKQTKMGQVVAGLYRLISS